MITRLRFCASKDSIRRYPVTLTASLVAALAVGTVPVYSQQSGTSAEHPQHHASSSSASASVDQKAAGSYSLGVLMGAQMHQFGLTGNAVSFEDFERGFKDVTSGKAQATEQDQEYVKALILHAHDVALSANHAAAHRFLEANGKRKGVITTASGLQYKVLKEGSGNPPGPTDTVTVNYRGTLLDGTEFDSSAKHGHPQDLQVDRIIKGWQEALVLMKPGARWELYVPPNLAYGDGSPGGVIPPGSLLKFEIELLKVAPTPPPSPRLAPNVGGSTSGR